MIVPSASIQFSNSLIGVWAWGLNLHYLSFIKIVAPKPVKMSEELILMRVPGRSRAHKIPQSSLASTSASKNIQSRCNSNFSFGCLYFSILDHYSWLALTCHRLGNTPSILPLPSHHHLHHSVSAALTHWPILVSFNLEACQYR